MARLRAPPIAQVRVEQQPLVDRARRQGAQKRGKALEVISDLDSLGGPANPPLDIVALDDALEALARIAPEKAKVVELRYFGGLSVEETAEFLDVSPATVERYWSFARAWLFRELSASDGA